MSDKEKEDKYVKFRLPLLFSRMESSIWNLKELEHEIGLIYGNEPCSDFHKETMKDIEEMKLKLKKYWNNIKERYHCHYVKKIDDEYLSNRSITIGD
jgi:hypothetical protein